MCQYDTDAPAQGHPHPHADIFLSKDITWKPNVLRMGRTDGTGGRKDSGDTVCPRLKMAGA